MLKFRALLVAGALIACPLPARAGSPAQAPAPTVPPATAAQSPAPQAPAAPAQLPAVAAATGQSVCGLPIPPPSRLPPANSKPVVFLVVPCFQKQGGSPVVEAQTYLYYIEMKN